MGRKRLEPNVYKITILDNSGKRQDKLVKATHYSVTDTPDSVLVCFENRGVMTYIIPFHSFVAAEVVEDKPEPVRLA